MFVCVCVSAQAHACIFNNNLKLYMQHIFLEICRKEEEEERKPNANRSNKKTN